MTKAVAFAVPSLNHSVCMEFFRSAMETDWLLAANGWNRVYLNYCGDQFIACARNRLVGDFLDNHPDVESFFFLDDDLGWPAAKVLEFLERDENIVVGIYPRKSEEPDWPVMLAGDDGKLSEKDGLVRVLRAPTGFMRIKRRVFEALRPHAPIVKHLNQRTGATEEFSAFFAAGVSDGWFWTEDYVFSQNVTAAGFDIWADPDVEFTHRGQKAWSGKLASSLPIFKRKAAQAKRERLKAEKAMQKAHGQLIKVGDEDVTNVVPIKPNQSNAA